MKITALAGGIGASKFLLGLQEITSPEEITVIANTGDDLELYGLRICPDVDTVTYTLAGVINPTTGWGIAGDSFESLRWLARYGVETWFNLGDRDLATHLYRSALLKSGCSLTEVTDQLRRALAVRSRILPMSDSYTPTRIKTDSGELHLQEYFVRLKCEPAVRGIRYQDIENSRCSPEVETAILDADLIIICPSNPFISIGPILAVPGVREALTSSKAAAVAVTPIIAGRAMKGPTAEMLRDLGHEASAVGVAELYRDIIDLFVLDSRDADLKTRIERLGLEVVTADTFMESLEDKKRLAGEVLSSAAGRYPQG